MYRTTNSRHTTFSAHRRLIASHDDDPLTGVANLFDVAMVFVVALMLALVAPFPLPELLSGQKDVTRVKNPGHPNMETLRRKGEKLEHYRLSQQTLGGEGEKLGTAYRLRSGEVVYVPDEARRMSP